MKIISSDDISKSLNTQKRVYLCGDLKENLNFYVDNFTEELNDTVIALEVDKTFKLNLSTSGEMIGVIGTNGLKFPCEVIVAGILNCFIYAKSKIIDG